MDEPLGNIVAVCDECVASRENTPYPSVLRDGDETWVKVCHFPGNEAMWVKLTEGDPNNGKGTLDNDPICSDLKHGDIIAFEGGDDETKPHFVEVFGRDGVNG